MPQLIFYIENDFPQAYNLATWKISVGKKDTDIVVNHPSLAEYHAELTQKEDGSFCLENVGEPEASRVNGEPVKNKVDLKDSDKIELGSVKAIYFDQEEESSKPVDNPDALEKLIRKGEIERNNLKMLRNDSSRLRIEVDKLQQLKNGLESTTADLSKQVETANTELTSSRKEKKKLAEVIYEANTFKKNAEILDREFTTRKAYSEELAEKIAAGEKIYGDLDLENAIKEKEQLTKDLEQLNRDLAQSKEQLEKNIREADEASAIFDEAKKVEAGIGAKEDELKSRTSDLESLEEQIEAKQNLLDQASQKISETTEEQDRLTASIKEQNEALDKLQNTLQDKENQIEAATSKLTEVESNIEKGHAEVTKTEQAKLSLENESVALNRIVSQKAGVLQLLKSKINTRGTSESVCPPIRLINPGMSSLVHYFHHGAGSPDEEKFDPIGYHAFAACTRGSMHRDADSILSEGDPLLLLLSGDLETDKHLIESAAFPGRILLVCWREGHLLELAKHGDLDFTDLLTGVSGIISADSDTSALLGNSDKGLPHIDLPTPSPVEFPEWNLSVEPADKTRDLFICGDGFDPEYPIYHARVAMLNQLMADSSLSVTFYQSEAKPIEGLKLPDANIEKRERPLKYSEYLQLASTHHLIAGFGKHFADNDVSGDAILAHSIFIGADSEDTVDQLLFPDTAIEGEDYQKAVKFATNLLSDSSAYLETMERSQSLASQLISFDHVRDQLGEFIRGLS